MEARPRGKEEERGKIPYFKTIDLTDLTKATEAAKQAGKYLYIADMSGQASTFFTYQAKWEHFGWHGQVKKAVIKKEQTKKEAAEALRKAIYGSIFYGRELVIDNDTMVPALKTDYDIKDTLPLKDMIFHRANFVADLKGPKTFLRKDEDVDKDKNQGNFVLDENFNLIMLSNMKDEDCDDEIIQMVLDTIDHVEDWECIYIKPEE
jgi:hypothetical protein